MAIAPNVPALPVSVNQPTKVVHVRQLVTLALQLVVPIAEFLCALLESV